MYEYLNAADRMIAESRAGQQGEPDLPKATEPKGRGFDTRQMTDPNTSKRLPSDGSSVPGKTGDRVRPRSAELSDPHDVAPGVNDGPEDWEKYFQDHPFSGGRGNSVDDVDDILRKISAYLGEGVDQGTIAKVCKLVCEQGELIAYLEAENERLRDENAALDRFCEEHNVSSDQRNRMKAMAECFPVVARQDPDVLRCLWKRTQ
jgi:hypothetical protein